jgi:hypothetical protein
MYALTFINKKRQTLKAVYSKYTYDNKIVITLISGFTCQFIQRYIK